MVLRVLVASFTGLFGSIVGLLYGTILDFVIVAAARPNIERIVYALRSSDDETYTILDSLASPLAELGWVAGIIVGAILGYNEGKELVSRLSKSLME